MRREYTTHIARHWHPKIHSGRPSPSEKGQKICFLENQCITPGQWVNLRIPVVLQDMQVFCFSCIVIYFYLVYTNESAYCASQVLLLKKSNVK